MAAFYAAPRARFRGRRGTRTSASRARSSSVTACSGVPVEREPVELERARLVGPVERREAQPELGLAEDRELGVRRRTRADRRPRRRARARRRAAWSRARSAPARRARRRRRPARASARFARQVPWPSSVSRTSVVPGRPAESPGESSGIGSGGKTTNQTPASQSQTAAVTLAFGPKLARASDRRVRERVARAPGRDLEVLARLDRDRRPAHAGDV